MQRNLQQCSIDVKSLAYVTWVFFSSSAVAYQPQKDPAITAGNATYVRPIVEYASVVWSPHTQVLKSLLEIVQCKVAHFVFASVTAVLEKSNWTILEIE